MPHPAAPQVSLVFPPNQGPWRASHQSAARSAPPVTDIARSRLVTTVLPRGRVTCCGHYVPSGQTTDHDGRNRVHLSGHMGHYGRSRARSPGRAQRLATPPRRPAAAHCRVPPAARRPDGCAGKPPWRAAPVICQRPRGDLPAPGQVGWRAGSPGLDPRSFSRKALTACGYTVHAPCAAAGPGRAARQPGPGRRDLAAGRDSGNLAIEEPVFQDRAAHRARRLIRARNGGGNTRWLRPTGPHRPQDPGRTG